MKFTIRILLPAVLSMAASSQTHATELGQSPFAAVPTARGPTRALAVANKDFVTRLPPANDRDAAIDRFAADPANYTIAIDRDGDTYIVDYAIKPFQGSGFRGGGYRYVVDARSYRITSMQVLP